MKKREQSCLVKVRLHSILGINSPLGKLFLSFFLENCNGTLTNWLHLFLENKVYILVFFRKEWELTHGVNTLPSTLDYPFAGVSFEFKHTYVILQLPEVCFSWMFITGSLPTCLYFNAHKFDYDNTVVISL